MLRPNDEISLRIPKSSAMLDRLKPGEAQAVLRRLLDAHSDLEAEAAQIAESLLGGQLLSVTYHGNI